MIRVVPGQSLRVETRRRQGGAWSAWTHRPELRYVSDVDGLLPQVGEAQFRWVAGPRAGGWPVPPIEDHADDLVGSFVRVVVDGSPRWHGIIAANDAGIDLAEAQRPNGAEQLVPAVGVAQLLDSLIVAGGEVLVNGQVASVGACPIFNDRRTLGFRSAGQYPLYDTSAHVFEQSATASARTWTAYQILDHLIAIWARSGAWAGISAGGMDVVLSDPDDVLDYVPAAFAAEGRSILACVAELAGRERGLWARVECDSTTMALTIRVGSGLAAAIGSVPATTLRTAQLDWTGSPWIASPLISVDDRGVMDIVQAQGLPPLTAVTLWHGPNDPAGQPSSLENGWPDAAVAFWNASPTDPRAAQVYRRFLVKETWHGRTWNAAAGIRGNANPLGSENAQRIAIHGDLLRLGSGRAVELSGDLPWASDSAAIDDDQSRRAQPVVFVLSFGSWSVRPWTVAVERGPAAIVLDDGNQGRSIYADVVAGRTILITIGIREHEPIRSTWIRDRADLVNPLPRMVRVQTDHELHYVPAGVVRRLTDIYSPELTTQQEFRDDRPALIQAQELARAWHEFPTVRAAWTDRSGYLLGADQRGMLIESIKTGSVTRAINGIVTQVAHRIVRQDGAERLETSMQTDIFLPGTKGVL